MNTIEEYYPLAHFQRIFHDWWQLVLIMLLGSAFGYIFSLRNPPIYEAEASFYASIDATKLTQTDPLLYQYDEDIALAVIERALLDPSVLASVSSAAQSDGSEITPEMLVKNGRIERLHANWKLYFRSLEPQTAQKVTNLWAERGYALLQTWRETGQVLDYVVFEEPLLASMPEEPVLLERNKLILAGALIGLIAGLLLQWSGSLVRRLSARQ